METRGGLRKKITLFVLAGISLMLMAFGIAGYIIVQKSIDQSLNKRLALSRLLRNNIDNIIKDNINRLYDISLSGSVDFSDSTLEAEKDILKAAARYSLFTDGIFLLDNQGSVIASYPERIDDRARSILSTEPVGRMLALGKPVVSNIYRTESGTSVIFILTPLKDRHGAIVGAAGGKIDPTNPTLVQKLGLSDIGGEMFVDLVDSNGIVISSSNPGRILTQCNRNSFFTTLISRREEQVASCHVCHKSGGERVQKTVLAFVPLETAPWGISIQEPEHLVFAWIAKLEMTFALLGAVFTGTAFLITIGINRGIVNPLKELIGAAERIARGDLSRPVLFLGSHEIGRLGRSFETMRVKLLESSARIHEHTLELENRVAERTRQIRESQRHSKFLLEKVIKTQEEERRRIARELHDDTLQDLSAALMRLDMCRFYPEQYGREKTDEVRDIVLKAVDGVTAIIQNMRPTLLDDLGLSAAIKSLLDIHIRERGIEYFITMKHIADARFQPEIETILFRIIQETIVNIARHAEARNVFVIFRRTGGVLQVEIEDDGVGFDLNDAALQAGRDAWDRKGLGILGMKERALLINGKIEVCSLPGLGTRVMVRIPVGDQEEPHA